MAGSLSPRVSDIVSALAEAFPVERAEEWDRVGLLVGDPDAIVTGVVCALDSTREALAHAKLHDANVLVTHHPAFLGPLQSVVAGKGAQGIAWEAARAGIALLAAHTNLDRDIEAQELMPRALGLTPVGPIERSLQPSALVTVFVPSSAEDTVASAMESAGGGRVGRYTGCSFAASGRARFHSEADAAPFVGAPGEAMRVDEVRLEMVCPRKVARAVVEAAAATHPYEEPLISVSDTLIGRNEWRLGRVCETAEPTTLGNLADLAMRTYRVTPRVWGDPEMPVSRVGTTTGSGGSLLPDAIARGVHAFVAGEVRYHDAIDAVESGVGVIEIGHDVSEWPLVPLLERVVRGVAGVDADDVHVLPPSAGWWTPKERSPE